MANQTLFQSRRGAFAPQADARNHEGAPAYLFEPRHELAQYVATGCLNGTFYAGAEAQLEAVLRLCQDLDAEFIARAAVYGREQGQMKDMPALLLAVLSAKSPQLLARVFARVVDNGKMLRNFVQILRSGAVGRKSLGSCPKRLVRQWLEQQADVAVFRASVGQSPSMADIVKMVHPKPATPGREALYGYLLGRPHDVAALPEVVRQFEAYKAGETRNVPDVPFQLLTALDLDREAWRQIALNAPWQATRMNLNTFARQGVFQEEGSPMRRWIQALMGGTDESLTDVLARRLSDPETVRRARAFPYQLMVAYATTTEDVPAKLRHALQDALEVAIENVPVIDGKVYVCPDVSGSMTSASVTGQRKGASSAVRCIDVAALVAAAVLRKNPDAEVLPFEQDVVKLELNPRDSVMTNAQKLAAVGGGGTNCSAPLCQLNAREAQGDLVIFVSDNQSWVDARAQGATAQAQEWRAFKQRNPGARMVCLDIQPYGTTQAPESSDVLNIGGFSDQVFDVIAEFAAGRLASDHWVGVIERVEI